MDAFFLKGVRWLNIFVTRWHVKVKGRGTLVSVGGRRDRPSFFFTVRVAIRLK